MAKLYFHIPFNTSINNLNCSEENKNLWCSIIGEYLSEFSYLEFVHSLKMPPFTLRTIKFGC